MNLRSIFNIFRKKENVTETIAIAGHLFTVLDPIKMPKIRQAAIYMGEHEREWGMTKEHLLAYDDVLIKETEFPDQWTNKEDLAAQLTEKLKRLYNLLDTRRLLIQEDFQYTPFLRAACHMILIDDEDQNNIDTSIMSKKLNLCRDNEEILVFFLRVIRAFQQSTVSSFDISKMWEFLPASHLKSTESKALKQINTTIF